MDDSDNLGSLNSEQEVNQFLFQKASVGSRIVAFLIDHSIFTIMTPFLVMFNILGARSLGGGGTVSFLLFAGTMILMVLMYGFRDIVKGQSIGKRILGIGVRDCYNNFEVPSASRLFLRQIFSFLWPIEFLVLVFSKENAKMGDYITETGVYNLREYEWFVHHTQRMGYINANHPQSAEMQDKTGRYKAPKKKIVAIIIGVIVLTCVMFFGAILLTVTAIFNNHDSFQLATDTIRNHPEIIAAVGEIQSFDSRPTGNIRIVNGLGEANFDIVARGTYGDVRVLIEMRMPFGGDWEVVSLYFSHIFQISKKVDVGIDIGIDIGIDSSIVT